MASIFKSYICCKKSSEKYKHYKQGMERYQEELDLLNVIKSLRQLKTLVKLNMDNNQI